MPPFRVFKLRGDGSLHFVQETKPSKTQESVRDFAELWPGEYIVESEETGERVVICSDSQTKN